MIPSAVGFQCPECYSKGIKQTRQRELPYGGSRSRDPRMTTFVLMGINVAIWVGVLLTGGSFGRLFNLFALKSVGYCDVGDGRIALVSKADCLAGGLTWIDGVATGAWWQVVTNGFTHSDVLHIGFNMMALFFLGPVLERVLGRVRFLAIYFISLLGASLLVMLFAEGYVSTMGASGAIFGMLGAALLVALKHGGDVRTIMFWLVANLVFTFFAVRTSPGRATSAASSAVSLPLQSSFTCRRSIGRAGNRYCSGY